MSFGLLRTKVVAAHPKRFNKFALPIFIGFLAIIVGQSTVTPSANASIFGTIYNAPIMAFGGGNFQGTQSCPAGQVIVGVTFNQNPMSWGFRCSALDANFEVPALSSTLRATANYVFCPDGTAAVGFKMFNSGGNRLGISCKTPPLVNDTEVLTQFVANQSTTKLVTRTTQNISLQSMCRAGDVVVGVYLYANLWFDQLGARCAPFSKFTVTYNANGGSGTLPTVQQQAIPAASLTVSNWSGTRNGFRLSGWNTLANGMGTDYSAGGAIVPNGNVILYAKWTSTITYDGNTNSSGAVPSPTTAVSSAAITYLAPNDGSSASPNVPLAKTGFTFAGWNTLANGAGTSYPASSTGAVTETPYMLFDAANFNDTTNAWADTSGNSRSIPGTAVSVSAGNIRGNPSKVTNVAGTNGASKEFPAVQGATTDGIVIGNGALTNYTFCHVARYAGTSKNRIFAGITGNWLSGFWGSATGVAYHEGWITASTGVNDTNWKIQCDTGGSRSSLRSNGTLKSSIANNATGLPANISINSQGSRNAPSEVTDWAVAYFVIYDSVLSESKIQEIEAGLNRKYGVGLFTSTIDTYNYASTGDKTLYAQWNSTITYNGNGQTSASSTVPAPTIAKGTAANTTLANAGTMARSNYTFAGWNTQADGLGTNYASGLTTYASTGSTTLYAKWTATITFSPNGASGSPATSSSNATSKTSQVFTNTISAIPLGDLPTVGTMVRPGYTFIGWNTAANGSGTRLSGSSTSNPFLRYVASDYDTSTVTWANSGSAGSAFNISGTNIVQTNTGITKITSSSQGGSNASFTVLKGDTSAKITFPNSAMSNYTLCHVARYAGAAKQRIFTDVSTNWGSGYLSGSTGAYYGGGGATSYLDRGVGDENWHLICDYNGNFRNNGKTVTVAGRTSLPANIGVATWSTQQSDWEIAEVLLYSYALSTFQIEALEASLKTTYGLSSIFTDPSTPATAGSYLAAGNVTLYAQWVANNYAITYDTTNTTSGAMAQTFATAGSAVSLRTNVFTRTGYTFKNWNTAANGSGTTYTNGQSVTLFNNLTLYPQWNLIAPGVPTVATTSGNTEVTVTPTPAAASGTSVGPTTSMLVTAFNASGVALSPAKTCTVVPPATSCLITGLTNGTTYQFAATATNATRTSASSTKVNGIPAGVVVTYNASANSGIIGTTGTTGTSNATFTKGTPLVLPAATKSGYIFSGWYTTQSSGGALVGAAAATYSPTGAITLYARFSGIVYTINYNGNGNTGGTVPNTGSYEYGSDGTYNNTQVYTYTGADQTFTVPDGITGTKEVLVEVWGAGGGGTVAYYGPDYGGGAGGYTKATISTTTVGEVLTLKVGKGGTVRTTTSAYGGAGVGGNTSGLEGSSGGGYSGVFTGSTPLAISGGGGGASPGHSNQGIAGGGGGANQSGAASTSTSMGGRGGTTSAGGAKAASCATDGAQYTGGNGCGGGAGTEAGGGGGAGYYGGGGGNSNGQSNGGGGGGSGYLDATRGSLITATVGQGGALASTWAFPNKTSSNYGTDNAGRGGKSNTNTTADSGGGNGRIVIQWKTGSGAHVVGAGPTKVGYSFAGWNTAANGTGTSYSATTAITPSSDITLFAQWTAASRTVTYALDGGTSTATTTQLTGKVVGDTVTLPASNTMTKTGYSFAGWSDGTNTYAGGATWTVPASDSNFTLTALWNTQTLTYSYDTNGGGTAPDGGTKTYGQTLVLAASTGLSKTGYTFAGWNDGATTSNAGASVSITTNKIFVAQWSAQSFSITYDGNGSTSGSVTAGSYVAGGVPYAIAANGFTRAGYNFAGWHTTAGGTGGTDYVAGAGYSTAANLVLYAKWTPASYTITYNGNGSTGGTVPNAGTLTTDTTFNADNNSGSLVKIGYTFAGWNTAANGSGSSIATSGVVTTTSNLTLYAQWTIISPLITFNKGIADSVTLPASTSANFGALFTLPATDTSTVISAPNDGNYAFTGWSDGTAVYQVGSSYRMGSANVIFTAQWVAIYTVRYVLNGGTGAVPSDQLRENDFRETLTSATVTKAGYSLSGWTDQSGVTIPSGADNWVISGTSYIAYAQWTATPRTLSFGLDSGSEPAPADITGKIIGEIVTLPTTSSTKAGYTFGGWSTGGVTYPAGGTVTIGTADIPFTAVWIGNTNTITYNGNGATGGTAPAFGTYVTGSVTPFTVTTNSGALVKDGFTFDGWYTTSTGSGGTAYVEGTGTLTTSTDITLYAKWNAASYVVTYDPANSSSTSTENKMYGSSFTLPSAPTKAGNNFLGWEITVNSVANTYAPGSTFTMGSSAITFTAKWTGIYYAVTYALNGGAGTAPTQANVASGGSFITAAEPTKSGFTFAGWSDGATTTNASTSITNVSGNITLTAQWTIAAPGIPGAPTATPGNGSATITIAAPTTGGTPSSYTVTASPGGATCTVTAPGTSCTIAPLTNGTAYTFTSTATNATGSSVSNSTASAAVTPAGVPQSPSSITGSGTGGSSTIEWVAPTSDGGSPITDYVIEYSVAGSGTWTTFSDGTSTATSATITGLIAGNGYEFRVSAKNVIGSSLPSFTSPVVDALPTAPIISSVIGASEKVTVTWNASSHLGSGTLTDYEVTAYDANGDVAGSCNPASGQLTCDVTGLVNGSGYTFKVAAITTVGSSAQSSASSVAIPAGVPSAPANVVAVTSGSNMTVTFDAPEDTGGSAITSYVVTSSPAGATCTLGANATTYSCTGLTAGTNYTYSVKAVNSKGESSASLDSEGVTAVAAPSAPLNVSAVITAGTTTLSATVSFDPPASENGSPIISYTVTASPGGATCTVSAPTTYCEILVLPDSLYTFTATATNAVGTSPTSTTSLQTAAANGIAPTLVVDPIPAPTGDLEENKVLSSNITFADYNSTPNSVVTYQWKRCTDPLDDTTCTSISGATNATYTLGSSDVDKYIRVEITATNSIGTLTKLSDATEIITAAPVATPSTPSTPSAPAVDPTPQPPSCDASCQAIRDAAAAKAAADAAAKAAADKLAADAAAKLKADADARTASDKASAAAKAAADAAKAAVEKAGAAAAAKAAADAAAAAAAAQAKAAADAQAAANRAAAAAQAALKNSAASAAAKAAATASAARAAAAAQAAVKAAATAAQNATKAKTAEANANKQVDIAINSLSSKTASAKATAEANAIAAAAKAAANEAAAAAAARATEARATAATAQKAASDAAARIATEQRAAATAAAAAKAATEAAAKASAEKIAATNAEKVATETLVKVLNEKAALTEQAANATDTKAREEIAKKIEEIETRLDEVEAAVAEAQEAAEEATAEYEEASDAAAEAQETAAEKAQDAVDIKAEVATKTAAATKAAAAATVATKVATAAKAAAAKVPSKAVIVPKPSTSKNKNSAKATVTGLKPGQKVKVTVNVKPRP
jgi:uncharacterized repeat protein (TIGR02543 family)